MTCNVFGGMLNLTQSIWAFTSTSGDSHVEKKLCMGESLVPGDWKADTSAALELKVSSAKSCNGKRMRREGIKDWLWGAEKVYACAYDPL